MEFILKNLPPPMLLMFLPMLLVKLGSWFKNKDAGETGSDDVFGNLLIAAAPAVEAISAGNENALKKSLNAAYIILGNYLGKTPQ